MFFISVSIKAWFSTAPCSVSTNLLTQPMPWLGLLTPWDAAALPSPEPSRLWPNWTWCFMECCMNPLALRYWQMASLPSESLLLPFFDKEHPCSAFAWQFQSHCFQEVLLDVLGQDLSTQIFADPFLFVKAVIVIWSYILIMAILICVSLFPALLYAPFPLWSRIRIFNMWHTVGTLSQCLMKEAINECKTAYHLVGQC